MRASVLVLSVAALLSVSCGGDVAAGPALLSEWGLFTDMAHQIPADGVVPYEVNAALFSDYAHKHRFIRVPPGEVATVTADGHLSFPDGTVIVKTFGFLAVQGDVTSPERLIETRLLVRDAGEWTPLIYLYDADMREARLSQYGTRVDVSFTTTTGGMQAFTYRVPNAIQCRNCHGVIEPIDLLGVHVR